MAGSFSNYLENALLGHVSGVAPYTAPTQLNLALMTARGTDAQADANTAWTEVSGGSYARQNIGVGAANWSVGVLDGVYTLDNDNAVPFPTATADWGTVVAFAIYDQSANLIFWGDLTTSKSVPSGATASFAAGALDVTLD